MKRKIVICEYISTGINYIDDVRARGYEPVLLEGSYIGTEEEQRPLREAREAINKRLRGSIQIIPENPDYQEVLRQVRALDPVLVIPGSEFGVVLATRLSADLGLPGNPIDRIRAMTEKDAMHEALRQRGLRYIRGKVVASEAEALDWYDELGTEDVVVKRVRGAATQGVYLCHGREEMLSAVRTSLSTGVKNGDEDDAILVQERILGREYIVNTVSCGGKHRVVSAWVYDKVKLPNGTNAYNYAFFLPRLEVGHSRLLRYACQVVDAIGIQYGPVHGEYMTDENGPVLIEVNCRPMGAGLQRQYLDRISGQHETDSALDAYLDPAKFEAASMKPYRPRECAAIKSFILPTDTEVCSAPVLQIAMRLKSYTYSAFDRIGRSSWLSETSDLETIGGQVYLAHADETQVRADCELLHLLEMKYPRILFQDEEAKERDLCVERDIGAVMKNADCRGATLVFSDSADSVDGAMTVKTDDLEQAYNSYDQGILDLSSPDSFLDLESVIQQIYVFSGKIRKGGRLLIPESTYCHLPYGIEGMEILLRVAGLRIELPLAGMPSLLVASVQ